MIPPPQSPPRQSDQKTHGHDDHQHPVDNQQKSSKVLLTGYGPFKTHSINASYEIVHGLPSIINIASIKNDNNTNTRNHTKTKQKIELEIYKDPIKVSYKTIRNLIPKQLYKNTVYKIDLVIHVGISNLKSNEFVIEKRARKLGYLDKDIDGVIGDDLNNNIQLEKGWEDWKDGPNDLFTSIDIDQLINHLQSIIPNIHISSSDNAGLYLCEYIYYSSLFHFHKKSLSSSSASSPESTQVLFVHVPPSLSTYDLELGL